VFVDPSHGTGVLGLIEPMSLAAVAAGADGLEIEVHIDPANAMSDKDQQLSPEAFTRLMKRVNIMRELRLQFDAESA
jgi:3-deoxy-7-phosphoheptulonate synthase